MSGQEARSAAYPARDPFPPPPAVRRALERAIKRATDAIKQVRRV